MLGGTIVGQFVGVALDAVVLGRHAVVVPLGCSVVLEALIGARYGASRVGHPLTPRERRRLSIRYSAALAAVSLPLVVWLAAAGASGKGLPVAQALMPHDLPLLAAVTLGALVACTAVRYVLLGLFAPAPRAASGAA
jgi:hypothetical protein